ncbi:hypothetical protein COB11_07880 [Candidatus Aerophobetes bacterium]|uniref:Uncharacterized protein n=1 Tax=Aerophobetes bacterium TaxID=2030807 RepID=A0A2A4YBV8_UNCAE|nr:MAG: hypothetical protein COB11_07880 [Candidatus Aerophobetes bacterium]
MNTLSLKIRSFLTAALICAIIIAGACVISFKLNPKNQVQKGLVKTVTSVEAKYIQDFSKKYIKDMEEQYGLTYYRGGHLLGNTARLDITFSSHKKLDVINARETLVGCSEEYLQRVNNDEKLRVLLDHHPIKNTELDLGIIFLDKNDQWFDRAYIANVSLIQGIARYKAYDRKQDRFRDSLVETYQNALDFVQPQYNNMAESKHPEESSPLEKHYTTSSHEASKKDIDL